MAGQVYPVHSIDFTIGTKGAASTSTDMVSVADLVSFSLSMENNIDEWTPMDQGGWARSLATGKKLVISLTGQRSYGDKGNDYIAAKAYANGLDCNSKAQMKFPDGSVLKFDCVIDVKNPGGGESTNVIPLEFDLICDGKPEFTESA